MVLSEPEIRESIKNGEIRFDPPIEESQYNSASIDLRLGYNFTVLQEADEFTIGLRKGFKPLVGRNLWIDKELQPVDEFGNPAKFELKKNQFVLATTLEHVYMPDNLIAMVEGRSTYARAGLSMHQTAPWIQPGWKGCITLEIRNSGPWNIDLMPKNERPCQLTFLRLTSTVETAYGDRSGDQYQGQTSTLPRSC